MIKHLNYVLSLELLSDRHWEGYIRHVMWFKEMNHEVHDRFQTLQSTEESDISIHQNT